MMVVATPRATIASQLKKGTVQLNVLQIEEKETVNIRRHGKAPSSQTFLKRVNRGVREGILIFFPPKQADLDAPAVQIHHSVELCRRK